MDERKVWKRHPLIVTFLASLFAALPASLILEVLAIATGPDKMNRFVRETIVIFWAAGMLGALAFVGFRETGKKKREGNRISRAALMLFSVMMALASFAVLSSAVIILIDAGVTGTNLPVY